MIKQKDIYRQIPYVFNSKSTRDVLLVLRSLVHAEWGKESFSFRLLDDLLKKACELKSGEFYLYDVAARTLTPKLTIVIKGDSADWQCKHGKVYHSANMTEVLSK